MLTASCRVLPVVGLVLSALFWSPASSARPPVREAPRVLEGTEQGIGRILPDDLTYTDLNGTTHRISDLKDARAVVFLLTGTSCPLCRRYAPSLALLEKDYADRGVEFIFVNPNRAETVERIHRAIATQGFQSPYVRDSDQHIIRTLQARTSTEAFVFDADRRLQYRGAVDDQYGFGYARNAPRHTYLRDALDAVLQGRTPNVTATTSPGCELWIDDDPGEPAN